MGHECRKDGYRRDYYRRDYVSVMNYKIFRMITGIVKAGNGFFSCSVKGMERFVYRT